MKRTKIVRTLTLVLGLLTIPIVCNGDIVNNVNLFNVRASASEQILKSVVQDGITYYVYETYAKVKGGNSGTPGHTGLAGDIVIADDIEGKPVKEVGSYAFQYCKGITSVKLPENIEEIGSYAFSQCVNIQSLNIPEGVKNIDNYAFDQCKMLTSITIPKNMDTVKSNVFSYCQSVTDINIPENIKSIEPSAFMGCSGLTNLSVPNDIKSIGKNAFFFCNSLNLIELREDLVKVANPDYISGTWFTLFLYDKDENVIKSCRVRGETDISNYLNKVGTSWSKISGSGLSSNVTDNLEFQLTGELIGSIPEQKLEPPILSTVKESFGNRENALININ